MDINEVIDFIYTHTDEDFVIVDCQILEELRDNLENNTKPIYPLDEIKGVVTDIIETLSLNDETKSTLNEFVAEIDSKFFNGDKIEESIKEKLSDDIRDWVELAKEKYSEIKNDTRKATMLDMCKDGYELAEFEVNKYSKGTVDLDFTKQYISEVKKAIKKNDYTERFFYFLSALGWVYAFDLEEILESMGELNVVRVKSIKKIKKVGRNVGYKKMGDIVANLDWDKLDSANFKNMGYRLDDFYVDERFFINQKDYMKAFNKCEDNPKMLGKEVNIKATRLEDNQPLIIICKLDERADVENLYMSDFYIEEVMLDTF